MAISGIVINLEPDAKRQEEAVKRLSEMPQLELGSRNGRRVPAVMDTRSVKASRACWDDIMALPGVEGIDLIYVNYEDETAGSEFDNVEEAET